MDLSVVPFASDDEDDNVGEPPVERPNRRILNHVEKVFKSTTNATVAEPSAEPVVVNPNSPKIRYAECMRNHAASVGGHANDGCGEFMECPQTPLTCAACGCHRNFHRREVSFSGVLPFHNHNHNRRHNHRQHKLLLTSSSSAVAAASAAPCSVHYNVGPLSAKLPSHHHHPPPPPPLTHQHHRCHHHDEMGGGGDSRSETPERVVVDGHDMVGAHMGATVAMVRTSTPTSAAGSGGFGSSGKRFRTKFTQEQKDRMLEFAEKLGWRIQRHDDVALNQFCDEIGVKRHVLKVWMHNNKNAHLRRSTSNLSDSPTAGVPSIAAGSVAGMSTATTSLPSSVPPSHSVGI